MYLLQISIRFYTFEQLQSRWCGQYHQSDLYIPQCDNSKVRSVFILKQNLPTLQTDKMDMTGSQRNAEEPKHKILCPADRASWYKSI